MSGDTPAQPIQRTAKGKKPVYFDAVTDRLLNMIVALVGEVAVLRDRLDTVELLSEAGGVFPQSAVDGFATPPEQHARREAWREAYLARVMRTIEDEIARMGETDEEAAEIFEGAHLLS